MRSKSEVSVPVGLLRCSSQDDPTAGAVSSRRPVLRLDAARRLVAVEPLPRDELAPRR